MFRSGFPFQIWFLILSGLRLNPVLTLSYPFISLLFSFGCASTFFTSIALLKLDCEDLMYDSAQSLFFSPFFYPFFSRRIWCPPLYSIAVLQSTSRIRASFIGCIPFTADSPGVAVSSWCSISSGRCFLSCFHNPAGSSSYDIPCRLIRIYISILIQPVFVVYSCFSIIAFDRSRHHFPMQR